MPYVSPAEMNAYRGDAAALIRKHLWEGNVPPKSPDSRPWTMNRELDVWNRLVKAGFKPEDINGAIAVVRTVRPYDGQLKLTVFYWFKKDEGFGSTPFLEACIGYHHKNQRDETRRQGRLPPSIQDTMRRMVT